jgi:hypothetical protein
MTSVVLLVTERQVGLSGSKDKDKSNDKSRDIGFKNSVVMIS